MLSRSHVRTAFSTLALAVGLSVVGCSGDSGDSPAKDLPLNADPAAPVVLDPNAPPAAAPGTTVTSTLAPTEGVSSQGTEIRSEEGTPRILEFRYFGRPDGFPTYKAHLVSTLSHLFQKIVVENPTDKAALVEVKGELQGFTKSAGSTTLELAAHERRELTLDPTLDYEALDKVSSPIAASFAVSLSMAGRVVSSGMSTTKVLPKNTVFWTAAGQKKRDANEVAVAIAILTTPHDRAQAVDGLLRDAAPKSQLGGMIGYQYQARVKADQHYLAAMDQLGAIYDALQERGMNYTSVPTSFFDGAQNVRYPTESLAVDTANCIDGSLLFAAAAEAIGMHPVVFVFPNHALVAVRAGEAGTPAYDQLIPIETTVVQSHSFSDAVKLGLAKIKGTPADQTLRVDIQKLRENDILPSPFPL